MQKWEYLLIIRELDFDLGFPIFKEKKIGLWHTYIGQSKNPADKNIDELLSQLGDEGWELVNAWAESGAFGGISIASQGTKDIAGFTTVEKWVFKRPKE